ncbi:threonine aldolase family protein [Shimia ponticola]|uniref:threonine aldolase family protein n=1 Tax=Shimia ponticola TaxID=2582893 RepID=UPI0011BE9C8E|nr:beta-eliminating lyase-related protein [Shimia ponticola]
MPNLTFASDNTGPAHTRIMQAVVDANTGPAMPYGADELNARAVTRIREVFEAPDAAVYFVATGTAANALILATLANPWDAIYGHRTSHIEDDECNAPEFYAGGAKLRLVDGPDGKMTPEALRAAIAQSPGGDVHTAQRGPVSITQATEKGTAHTLGEIRALTQVAHDHGLSTHMDGARFTNAMVHLDCTAAEMTWKSGIDTVSFGGTKNGCLGVEAAIFFDPKHAWEFELRRKRGAHLWSKHRFLSAQMDAYMSDGLWIDMAQSANGAAARLAAGITDHPDTSLDYTSGSNLLFARFPRAIHTRLHAAGARYYLFGDADGPDDEQVLCRLVCDWSKTDEDVDAFLALMTAG